MLKKGVGLLETQLQVLNSDQLLTNYFKLKIQAWATSRYTLLKEEIFYYLNFWYEENVGTQKMLVHKKIVQTNLQYKQIVQKKMLVQTKI